jgi:hypothetical protein
MSDVYMGNTQLGDTKATLISNLVQRELAFAAILRGAVTDVSNFAQPGAKEIKFPKLTSFSVSNRSEGVLGETTAVSASSDLLQLNLNSYVSWAIDAFTAKQTSIDSQLEAIKLASAAMGRFVDENIIAKMVSSAASFVNVGTDANVTYANLVDMRKTLLKADAILGQCAIVASPAQEAALMQLTEFKDASVYGGQAVVPRGVVGSVLGMPIYIHNGLADKQLFMFEKSSIAIGFQKEAQYGEESFLELGVGAKRCAVDQYWGLAAMQTGLKGAASGKSPLIIGLND